MYRIMLVVTDDHTPCITSKTVVGEGNKHNVIRVMSNHSARLVNTNHIVCKFYDNSQGNDCSIILVASNKGVFHMHYCVVTVYGWESC